jgi:hypothetical protein
MTGPFDVALKSVGDVVWFEVRRKVRVPVTARIRRRERRFKAVHTRLLMRALHPFVGKEATPELRAQIKDVCMDITGDVNRRFGHLTRWEKQF